MIEANTTNSANYANFANGTGDDQFRFREAFVQIGNVLESQPGAKFWAGERYYRRSSITLASSTCVRESGFRISMDTCVTSREFQKRPKSPRSSLRQEILRS